MGLRSLTRMSWRGVLGKVGRQSALARGVVALTAAVPAVANAQQPTTAAPLVFDGVTVVDVEHGKLIPSQRVVVTGNHIQAVQDAGAASLPSGAHVVDARGKYLIPGLWDMHHHVLDKDAGGDYPLFIANGVTGIREPAPSHHEVSSAEVDTAPRQWQREVAAGTRVGPRQPQQAWAWRGQSTGLDPTATPETIRHAIDSLKAAGAEFLKFSCRAASSTYDVAGGNDNCTPENYFALLAAVRRNGMHAVGHPQPSTVSLVQAADSGQRSFEHLGHIYTSGHMEGICVGDSASLAKCQALAHALRRDNAWITPTLMVTGPAAGLQIPLAPARSRLGNTVPKPAPGAYADALARALAGNDERAFHLRRFKDLVAMMQQADMPLLAGTDLPADATIHEELALMVTLGVTPLGALQAATLNPAKYLQTTDSMGTIAPGKLADLVLLDANPLDDITNTTTIRAVVANGRYFDRAALDALFAEVHAKIREEPAP